jgi:hypothetical protein
MFIRQNTIHNKNKIEEVLLNIQNISGLPIKLAWDNLIAHIGVKVNE